MPLQVIGAGVGRTGTYSLKLALEQLGFSPCYHMEEVLKDPGRAIPLWNAALAGNPDWEQLFAGYDAAVDWPTAAFWPELAAAYPAAKVVLTTRAAESWCQSYSETIAKFMSEAHKTPPEFRPWFDMAFGVVDKSGFAGKTTPPTSPRPSRPRSPRSKPPSRPSVFWSSRSRTAGSPLCRFLDQAGPRHPVPADQRQGGFLGPGAPGDRLSGGAIVPTGARSEEFRAAFW